LKYQMTSMSASKKKGSAGKRWSKNEDEALRVAVDKNKKRNWKEIAREVVGRSEVQCLHRWQKVLAPGLRKGPWSHEEDEMVKSCMQKGMKKWSEIAKHVPGRIGKQCRERWHNHLDPAIKKDDWSKSEDNLLFELQAKHGNKWSYIATMIEGRTENAVKNRWNGSKRKRQNSAGKTGGSSKSTKQTRKKKSVNHDPIEAGIADSLLFLSQSTTPWEEKKVTVQVSSSAKKRRNGKKLTLEMDQDSAQALLRMSSAEQETRHQLVASPISPLSQDEKQAHKRNAKKVVSRGLNQRVAQKSI